MAKVQSQARPSRLKRRALGCFLTLPALALGLWAGVHHIPGFGPAMADAGRAVAGNEAISELEDVAYGAQDSFNRWYRRGDTPKSYWEIPDASAAEQPDDPRMAEQPRERKPRFHIADVPPMHPAFAAPGDGRWVPIVDGRHPEAAPLMFKTLLHPDDKRGWTAVVVVAVDLTQTKLHLAAGRVEPQSDYLEARAYDRLAVIAPEDLPLALAAFNGGFKTTHGHYGMKADGITFIRPRIGSCTLAMYADDAPRIADWKTLKDTEPSMLWFRQTPQCMAEDGELHIGLRADGNTHWGATVDRNTVIRRSAIGLSKDRSVLYVSIGDHTTARAIATAMHHAGAHDIAQLDVNFSYPKFLTIEPKAGGGLYAKPIADGFEHTEDDYITAKSDRDFFYLTRKPVGR